MICENENELLFQVGINEKDKIFIDTSLRLVSDVISQKIDNGLAFIDNLSMQNITNQITDIAMAVHGLKRVMIFDFTSQSDSKIQKKFYNSSK